MRPGDPATKISDGGDQRRPGLGRAVGVRAIVAARMEAKWVTFGHSHDTTAMQILVRQSARDWLGHGVETPCRFGRATWGRKAVPPLDRRVRRQTEKHAGLVEGVAQAIETAVPGNEV